MATKCVSYKAREYLRSAVWLDIVEVAHNNLGKALLRVAARLLHKRSPSIRNAHRYIVFNLQITHFISGAEGTRTPGLRRAKSEPYCRRRSLLFRKSRKTAYFF